MARPLRIERAGGWYHVSARGNERRAIYRDDRDRRHFLEVLAEMVLRYRVRLLGLVLNDDWPETARRGYECGRCFNSTIVKTDPKGTHRRRVTFLPSAGDGAQAGVQLASCPEGESERVEQAPPEVHDKREGRGERRDSRGVRNR